MVYCEGADSRPCHNVFPRLKDGIAPTIQFRNLRNMMKAP